MGVPLARFWIASSSLWLTVLLACLTFTVVHSWTLSSPSIHHIHHSSTRIRSWQSSASPRVVLKMASGEKNDPAAPSETQSPSPVTTNNNKKNDKSLLTKIGSTTSAVVAGTFYLVLAWQRDALMVSFFIGAISNGILSKVLKKLLKQERPAELIESDLDLPPSDNGMPSSHAMSLGFIGTFTALQLPWTTVPILLYVIISLVYRVQSKLHTIEQIAVGVTVGSLNGYVWRTLCFGNNPFGINIMEWVSNQFLNDQGLLPWYGLAIPALVGAAVVGSVERRIKRFLSQKSKTE